MRSFILVFCFAVLAVNVTKAQGGVPAIKKTKLEQAVKKKIKNLGIDTLPNNNQKLTKAEIVDGLKEALSVGVNNSVIKLGAVDGFFKDSLLKILMPKEAVKVERKLRNLGMGKTVDNAIMSMNRAAEDATTGVKEIFVGAIKGLTIQDGLSLLKGSNTAATEYLRSKTMSQLTEKITPVVKNSLQKVDATKYWKDIFTNYNKIAKEKVNPDLIAYVTQKTIDGIFIAIAGEEQKIRNNPVARVSDILKKVFGQ